MNETTYVKVNTSLALSERAPSNSLNIENIIKEELINDDEQKEEQKKHLQQVEEDDIGTEYFKNLTIETIEYLKGQGGHEDVQDHDNSHIQAPSGRETISNLKVHELGLDTKKGSILEKQDENDFEYEKNELNDFIMEAYKFGANALDLSKKNLTQVPNLLSKLDNLQYLYLEGNELSDLPENFFSLFQSLKWLDLRNNKLTSIPSQDLANHCNLRYLLLENNFLKTIPIEIAHIKTLTALNLSNNPIEFPPIEVIEKGVKFTQEYLKKHSKLESSELVLAKKHDFEKLKYEEESRILTVNDDVWASDDENEFLGKSSSFSKNRYSSVLQKRKIFSEEPSPLDKIQTRILTTAAVQPTNNDNEPNAELKKRLSRARNEANLVSKKNIKRTQSSFDSKKLSNDLNVYKNVSLEKAIKTGKIDKYKKNKETIDNRLQKVKDTIVIDHFRDNLKETQKKLLYKRVVKNVDYVEPVRQAPFDIDENYIEIMNNEERARLDDIMMREQMRAISPDTLMKIEEERRARDNYLQDKIREYTNKLLARRNQPKGDAKQDKFQAAQDLRELKAIEKELEQRRMELQYRFRAYTGDLTYTETEKINSRAKVARLKAKINK